MTRYLLFPLLSICLVGAARDEPEVVQAVPSGSINWTQHTLRVTGSGVPRTKLVNLSAVRLDAERAARAAVEVRLLEMVAALPLDGKRTGATALAESAAAATNMPRLLGGFHTVETRYFSDGGVDLVAEMSLDGAIVELLLRGNTDPKVSAFERLADAPVGKDTGAYTGLVVHGRGLGLAPVVAPTLKDVAGTTLYDGSRVGLVGLRTHGAVAYTKSLDAAMRDPRVGDHPKVMRLTRIDTAGHWVVDSEDSKNIKALDTALREGRVMVVID